MLYVFLYLRYINISLVIYTIVITTSPVRAPAMCHGFRQPWIPIRQPGKRHFIREEKGIKTIATVTVLKKERPDSLGADILEISEVQNFDCYVIMTVINRTQTSV